MARMTLLMRLFILSFVADYRKLAAESCIFPKTFRTLAFKYLRTIPLYSFETLAKRKYCYFRKN